MKNNKIQKNKKCFLTVFHQEPPLKLSIKPAVSAIALLN